jgi:levanase
MSVDYSRRTALGMFVTLPLVAPCRSFGVRLALRNAEGDASGAISGSAASTAAKASLDGRPRYHIAAPDGGWINDPQRPLKVGNVWTLWALYNPTYPKGGTSWRRWTSKDLVTWQDGGIAIPRNTTAFGDIWTGSTVIDTENSAGFGAGAIIALATMPASNAKGSNQSCALWYSLDGGASFRFDAIVLPNYPGNKAFRDPAVFWHQPTRRWVLTLSEEGKIGIYISSDLKAWSYASGFLAAGVDEVMECSHLFNLHLYDADGAMVSDKWILLAGRNGTKQGFTVGTYYWVGDFNGTTFKADADSGHWLDGGADFYATVAWQDTEAADPLEGAYAIAWMSNWDYANQLPHPRGYQGQLSVVRQLRLQVVDGLPRLRSNALAQQNGVFDHLVIGNSQLISDKADYDWPAWTETDACRIDLTLTRKGEAWPSCAFLSVREDGVYSTKLIFEFQKNLIILKRDMSGPSQLDVGAWKSDRSVACNFHGGSIEVGLLVDTGSIEVFVNAGSATISELISAPLTATGLHLKAEGGSAKVSDVVIRSLSQSKTSA